MKYIRSAFAQTFLAIKVRNYRLYFTGQVISVSGTWMQMVAQVFLVLNVLHGSGVDVGIVTALQFLPMLLAGSWGGLIADRLDKRKLLYATQGSAGLLALILGLLTITGHITLLITYILATALGVVNLFDNPARQTFVSEMVGPKLLPNAVSLNSVLMNAARAIGPALGAVLIVVVGGASIGIGTSFLINAITYVAVIAALKLMDEKAFFRQPVVQRAKGQVREGLAYVWSTPELRDPLLAISVVGIFAFNFTVTLPLLAKFTFHGGTALYSVFTVAMGSGAVAGGLIMAHRSQPSQALLAVIGLVFGFLILAVALAPSILVTDIILVPMGAGSIAFIATANATLQLRADPHMRGRVMALFAIAFLGSTPIGAPLVGAISDATNPRVALIVGAVATLLACAPLALRYALNPRQLRLKNKALMREKYPIDP